MVNLSLVKNIFLILCHCVVAVVTASVASADDSALELPMATAHELIDHQTLDLSLPPVKHTEQGVPGPLDLPEQRSQFVSFVKKCAELEAVPLMDLSGQEDKEVFLGINFDGFLGVYARQ